jgi:uncharacterized phosphatase
MDVKMFKTEKTTVCIIRHGETNWNASGRLQGCEDVAMNERGRIQARLAANYLSSYSWDTIFSSPLQRALETAEIINKKINLPQIQISDALKERNYGEASGLLPDERRIRFPDGIIPGQEDFDHLKERAMHALNSIVRDYSGKKLLIVTHGAFTNSILYSVSEGAFGSFKTRLKNGCLNLLEFNKQQQWNVVFFNKTPDELIE